MNLKIHSITKNVLQLDIKLTFNKMKILKQIVCVVFVAALLISCNGKNERVTETTSNVDKAENSFAIIGKQVVIEYPEMKAEIHYLSDSTLHWKTTDLQNREEEGIEEISYQQVADNLFFLNWIEKDGVTVSQVMDTAKEKVYVYMSFSDEDSNRGQRSAIFMEGKVTFKD